MRYEPALDGLRAVAIIAVVLFHSAPSGQVPGGFIGVDLFFVLSGFLITSLLASEWEQTGKLDFRRFYVRRFLRLAPPLLLMLAAFVVWAPFVWPGDHFLDAGIAAAYIADYTAPLFDRPHQLGHMWSLAIEEQFYLLWPVLLVPLIRSRRAIFILAAAYLAVSLWRYSFMDMRSMYDRFDTHCSGLILGCLLYFIRYKPSPAAVCAAAAALLLLCFAAPPFEGRLASGHLITSFVITAAELAGFVLIAGAWSAEGPLTSFLRTAPMVWIGRLSYGIYLWHAPFAWAVRDHVPFALSFAIVSLLSTAAACASYFTVEAWVRKLKSPRQNPRFAAVHVPRSADCANLLNSER